MKKRLILGATAGKWCGLYLRSHQLLLLQKQAGALRELETPGDVPPVLQSVYCFFVIVLSAGKSFSVVCLSVGNAQSHYAAYLSRALVRSWTAWIFSWHPRTTQL